MLQSPKQLVALIAFSTLLAILSVGSIVYLTDPATASKFTHSLFYLGIFLTTLGSFTLIGMTIRRSFSKEIYLNDLKNSFRQSLLISLLATASIFLQGQSLLYWWVEASLILFLIFVEAFLNLKI